jgi:hypothetical protein
MQRNEPERRQNPRHTGEKNASQAIGGQPRTEDEENELQKPEDVPSLLTARELQARDPAKGETERRSGERHASASFRGNRAQPPITDERPARGDRGLPQPQTREMLEKDEDEE